MKTYHFSITLDELLEILDARARISIFTAIGEKPLIDFKNVYELLADKELLETYGKYKVTGLVKYINITNVLIEKVYEI